MEVEKIVILSAAKDLAIDSFRRRRTRLWRAAFGLRMTIFVFLISSTTVHAAPTKELMDVYWERPDLRAAFEPARFRSVPNSSAGFLIDLEDWAEQYGYTEYPSRLSAYAPAASAPVPGLRAQAAPEVAVASYLILDRGSGKILAAKGADTVWPMASITKLMTAKLVRDRGVALETVQSMTAQDDVGGAKISVQAGDRFSVNDLFYATLVSSANNAANALARTTALPKETFVRMMNLRAQSLNLSHTHFTDPTGIETTNVSTAREVARLAQHAFEDDYIRACTGTARKPITMAGTGDVRQLITTNWMLYRPEYDDVFVTAGKTGYLDESKWNVVVALRPSAQEQKRELMLVVFGAGSRAESFQAAKKLADWAWENHAWR